MKLDLTAILAAVSLSLAAPAYADTAEPRGKQWRGHSASSPAKLECAQFRIPRAGVVTSYKVSGTNGYWITTSPNGGPVAGGAYPNGGTGFPVAAGVTYYICADMPFKNVNMSWASITVTY